MKREHVCPVSDKKKLCRNETWNVSRTHNADFVTVHIFNTTEHVLFILYLGNYTNRKCLVG
jgi:hypothetical protein